MLPRFKVAVFTALIGSFAIQFGCATPDAPTVVARTPALLFSKAPHSVNATEIGRSTWPSVDAGLQSVEETVFVEYYRDFRGNAQNEQNTPYQFFRSYRKGVRLR